MRNVLKQLIRKLSEPKILEIGQKMGYAEKEVLRFQIKRLCVLFLCFGLGLFFCQSMGMYSLLFFFFLGGVFWFEKRRRLLSKYKHFSFERMVSFSKFCRMLIPYLLVENQGKSLYAIFMQLVKRLDGESMQEPLYQLLADMNDRPNEIDPFIRFAESCSGTDDAVNFMTTLFYFQQSSDDPTIIQELGRLANDELLRGAKEIVRVKVRRLGKYPTFLVFAITIPLLGIMGAFIVQMIQQNLLLK